MKAINDTSFAELQKIHGQDMKICSENTIISGLLNEIADENVAPLKLSNKSVRDDSVTQYFENSYAYVKFSK